MRYILSIIFFATLMTACSPEIGSDDWCKALKEKHKSDWTMREVKDFGKHCVFK